MCVAGRGSLSLHRGDTRCVGWGVCTPRGLPGVRVLGGLGAAEDAVMCSGWRRAECMVWGGATCGVWGGVLAFGRHNGVCGLGGSVSIVGCSRVGFGKGSNAWGVRTRLCDIGGAVHQGVWFWGGISTGGGHMWVWGFEGGLCTIAASFWGVLCTEATPSRSRVWRGGVSCAALDGLVGSPVPWGMWGLGSQGIRGCFGVCVGWGGGVSYMYETGNTPVTPCAKVDSADGVDPMWHMARTQMRVPRVPGGVRRGQGSRRANNSHPLWQQGWDSGGGVHKWGARGATPGLQLQGQA